MMFLKIARFSIGAAIFFAWLPLASGGVDKQLTKLIRFAAHGWLKADDVFPSQFGGAR
jgi:hypothetical protein